MQRTRHFDDIAWDEVDRLYSLNTMMIFSVHFGNFRLVFFQSFNG